MKKSIGLIVILGFVSLTLAQKERKVSTLQSLVDTERAFSRTSEEKEIRPPAASE